MTPDAGRAPSRRRRGTAALELAVLAPIAAALLVGSVEWGMALEQRIRLQTAVRAGAQVAMRTPAATADIVRAVEQAAPDFPSLAVSSTGIWCECARVATTCTATCGAPMERFLRVEASHPYNRLTPAGPTRISANVTLRLQ